MKRQFLTIVALSILVFGLFSCGESKEQAQLCQIEKMMDGNPNAVFAMQLLQSIPPGSLSSKEDKAYYALLMTQAEEKTTDMIVGDSLISIAVKYYSHSKDTYHNMLSQYYLGRTKFYAEDYSHSIVAMFKALECATELDNKFWMGMICQSLSDTYAKTRNSAEELVYAEKEYQYMQESGRQPYTNYALLDMARANANKGMSDKALLLVAQCADSATKYKDTYLFYGVNAIVGTIGLADGNYEDALAAYLNMCNSGYSNIEDSARLGLSYVGCGDLPKALAILKIIPDDEVLLKNMLKYKIYLKTDSVGKALAALETVDSITNNNFQKRIETNMTSDVVDYYKLSKEAIKSESKIAQIGLWLMVAVFVLVLLILGIIAYWAYTYNKRQQEKIEQNLEIAQQLKRALTTKEAEYDKARGSIRKIFSSNCKALDEMCRRVFENGDSDIARKHISTSVASIVSQIKTNPHIIKMFEEFVDINYSHLFLDFNKDLPDLPVTYKNLFLFSVLGFSDSSIALFMDKKTVSQIYNYRRHLKDKIKCLDEDKCRKYLNFL